MLPAGGGGGTGSEDCRACWLSFGADGGGGGGAGVTSGRLAVSSPSKSASAGEVGDMLRFSL